MAEFYNPYQFIEFTGKANNQDVSTTDFEQIKTGKQHIRHDYWSDEANIHHGRILCQLKLLSPTLTGNEHKEKDPVKTTVKQYQFKGQNAIQANSLRGMIASILETISQSSLRVLSDKKYRVSMGRNKVKEFKDLTFSFFSQSVSQDSKKNYKHALPWSNGRDSLTPAESLLGVVAEKNDNEEQGNSQNLASRVRFSDALGHDIKLCENEVPLKILASPKPNDKSKATPAANMYFKPRNGNGYIAKDKLLAAIHEGNGRKLYLPHKNNKKEARKTTIEQPDKNDNQRAKGYPLKGGKTLYFHIDFENLSSAELLLLQTSIHPADKYQHTIGMGKPLGLGQIELKIIGTFFIDRKQRYGFEGLSYSRYHAVNKTKPLVLDDLLSSRYAEEINAYNAIKQDRPITPETTLIDDETLTLIQRLGNTDNQRDLAISYPYTNAQKPYNETNGYDWAVQNNKKWHQYLATLNAVNFIPTLTTDGVKCNIEITLLEHSDEIDMTEVLNFTKQQLKMNNIRYNKLVHNNKNIIRLLIAEDEINQLCQVFKNVKVRDKYRLMCIVLK